MNGHSAQISAKHYYRQVDTLTAAAMTHQAEGMKHREAHQGAIIFESAAHLRAAGQSIQDTHACLTQAQACMGRAHRAQRRVYAHNCLVACLTPASHIADLAPQTLTYREHIAAHACLTRRSSTAPPLRAVSVLSTCHASNAPGTDTPAQNLETEHKSE